MKLYRNWIINEVARTGEHTNECTYNFVVRGDNKLRNYRYDHWLITDDSVTAGWAYFCWKFALLPTPLAGRSEDSKSTSSKLCLCEFL